MRKYYFKKISLCSKTPKSPQWYMISVVYVYHRMKSCEVLCYLNGRLALRQDVGFVNTSEVSLLC